MQIPVTFVPVFCCSDLRFHHVHGKNARVSNSGLTASRPRAFGEFNDAIVISNRALREGEMFEVAIEKMVDRWSGSIEAGERRAVDSNRLILPIEVFRER